MQARMLGIAEERGMIHWEYGAVDGAFSEVVKLVIVNK